MSQRSLREISALLDRFYDEQPDGGADAARAWAESTDGLRDDPLFVDDFVQAVAAGDAGLDGATALVALPSAALPREPAAGDRLGGFCLRARVGQGGMGQVWLADDEELRRPVALKLVRPERVSARSRELFAREARAGGRLSHPNVVATYAYGEDGGVAWIAQEFVEDAGTLRDFLDATAARAEVPAEHDRVVADLVARIADGLEALHQAGVVHRDLKPANVLIRRGDHPMITDFGLARIEDEAGLTQSGEVAGTWAYMSPEQVTGRSADIDRRSDVFSLGVMLYELLTRRRPFVGDSSAQVARHIQELDPQPVRALRSQCPVDLARICDKALEKRPADRYQTALAFAEDLRRFLAHEPILARPPGPLRRALKWARRHPTASATAALGVAALVVTSYLAVENGRLFSEAAQKGEQARRSATVAAERATEAERAQAAAQAAQGRAEDALAAAETALRARDDALAREQARAAELEQVARFQEQQFFDVDPPGMGLQLRDALRDLLARRCAARGLDEAATDAALTDHDEQMRGLDFTGLALQTLDDSFFTPGIAAITADFEDQPLVQASLRHAMANVLVRLGRAEAAFELAELAVDARGERLGRDHAETLASHRLAALALLEQGDLQAAEARCREVLAASRQTLSDQHPDTLACASLLVGILFKTGAREEAAKLARETLRLRREVLGDTDVATLRSMDDLAKLSNDPQEKERLLQEALSGCRQLGSADDDLESALQNSLALHYLSTGKLEDADRLSREALARIRLASGDEHPNTIVGMLNRAGVLRQINRLEQARPLLAEAVEASQRTLGDDHELTLSVRGNLGSLLLESGRLDEAEPILLDLMNASREALGPDHPGTLEATMSVIRILFLQERLADAEPLARAALASYRRSYGASHRVTLTAAQNLGQVLSRQGKLEEAEQLLRETLEARRALLGPDDPDVLSSAVGLGQLLQQQGRFAEAEIELRAAWTSGREELGEEHRTTLAAAKSLVFALLSQRKFADAAPLLERQLAAERAGLGEDHQATLQTRKILAEALLMSRDYAAAEPHLRELQRGLRTTFGDQHPAAASTTVTLARCLDQLDRRADARAVLRSFLAETELPKDHANVAAVQAALERFGQD